MFPAHLFCRIWVLRVSLIPDSLPSLPLWPEREAKMSDYNDYMELKKYYFEYLSMGIMTPKIKQLYWRSLKGAERSSRCRLESGTRCTKSCRNCPRQRKGSPLSLDAMSETGAEAADRLFSLEDHNSFGASPVVSFGSVVDSTQDGCLIWENSQSLPLCIRPSLLPIKLLFPATNNQ